METSTSISGTQEMLSRIFREGNNSLTPAEIQKAQKSLCFTSIFQAWAIQFPDAMRDHSSAVNGALSAWWQLGGGYDLGELLTHALFEDGMHAREAAFVACEMDVSAGAVIREQGNGHLH
jgi:hypothetical protein